MKPKMFKFIEKSTGGEYNCISETEESAKAKVKVKGVPNPEFELVRVDELGKGWN